MTAYRVIDDHRDLDNIGSLSHDQIDSHVSGTTFVVVSGAMPPFARRITAGTNVSIVDGGPGGNLTISSTGGGGGGTPGGVDTNVQFNDGGSFGGDTSFVFDKTSKTLSVNNLSGSLTRLTDGSPYIIAGPNVGVNFNPNGSITITATGAGVTSTSITSWMEVPSGDIDGINMVYSLVSSPDPTNALMLYLNGALQLQGGSYDYSLSGNTFVMNTAPLSGSSMFATYAYTIVAPTGPSFAWMEIPYGTTDGSNTTFTLAYAPYPASSLMLYVNGVLQRQGVLYDYTLSGNTVTMNVPPLTGYQLVASYSYSFVPTIPVGTSTSWQETPPEISDGTNTTFTLLNTPVPPAALMFFINGILQKAGPTSDYTLSGNIVTTNYAPSTGSNIAASYPY